MSSDDTEPILKTIAKDDEQQMSEMENYASSSGDLRLIKRLGGGSFGNVYECESPRGRMACKFMFTGDDSIENHGYVINSIDKLFLREACVYSYLANKVPGVCTVREIGAGYLGMCLEREDVESLLKNSNPITKKYKKSDEHRFLSLRRASTGLKMLDIEYIMSSMVSMLATLEILHSLNIVHMDIKPANILLGHDYKWKLCDFGISRKIRSEDLAKFHEVQKFYKQGRGVVYNDKALIDYITLTDGDTTLGYAAPETMYNSKNRLAPIFTALDIWSAGALFYELLTGLSFLGTTIHRDGNGDIIVADISHRLGHLFGQDNLLGRDKPDSFYIMNMLRFLTKDMKRSGMDFYDKRWKKSAATIATSDEIQNGNTSSTSPLEAIKTMRPELSSRYSKIWNLLVNMLDPNPLTRYTATDCINSELFRPYINIRNNVWKEYSTRVTSLERIYVPPKSSSDRTPLMKFIWYAMGKKTGEGKGWVGEKFKSFPGLRKRMYKILLVVNTDMGSKIKDKKDLQILLFCIYHISYMAEYGLFTTDYFDYNAATIEKSGYPLFLPGIIGSGYSVEEIADRINYTLYYIAVNLLNFNLWV